jgi:putative transposase
MKCKCGYENDRDIIACLNMLRMRGVPFPLKVTYEPIVVRLKG